MSARSGRAGNATRRRRAPTKSAALATQLLDPRPTGDEDARGLRNVGEIIKRLRLYHGWSLATSPARLGSRPRSSSAVERGESDIAVGRLARKESVSTTTSAPC
jgi:hypothetical protein